MKKHFLLLLLSIVTLSFFSSCSNNSVSINDFATKAKDLVGQEVTIKGVAQHICSHSGRKLFLSPTEGGETLVTVFTNPDMKPFDKETIGKTYTVKGIVKITNHRRRLPAGMGETSERKHSQRRGTRSRGTLRNRKQGSWNRS